MHGLSACEQPSLVILACHHNFSLTKIWPWFFFKLHIKEVITFKPALFQPLINILSALTENLFTILSPYVINYICNIHGIFIKSTFNR